MQSTHSTVLTTLMRVQRFMDTSGDSLGNLNTSGSRRALDDIVATLCGHAVNQASSKRVGSGETAKQRVLRNALKLNHMRPIAMVAKAQLTQVPEFLALKMPATNTTSRRLIAAAGAMAVSATGYERSPTLASRQTSGAVGNCRHCTERSLTNRGQLTSSQTGATAGSRQKPCGDEKSSRCSTH
jgi:hypothetical protein